MQMLLRTCHASSSELRGRPLERHPSLAEIIQNKATCKEAAAVVLTALHLHFPAGAHLLHLHCYNFNLLTCAEIEPATDLKQARVNHIQCV